MYKLEVCILVQEHFIIFGRPLRGLQYKIKIFQNTFVNYLLARVNNRKDSVELACTASK